MKALMICGGLWTIWNLTRVLAGVSILAVSRLRSIFMTSMGLFPHGRTASGEPVLSSLIWSFGCQRIIYRMLRDTFMGAGEPKLIGWKLILLSSYGTVFSSCYESLKLKSQGLWASTILLTEELFQILHVFRS